MCSYLNIQNILRILVFAGSAGLASFLTIGIVDFLYQSSNTIETGIGDYFFEADPAIMEFVHGNPFALYSNYIPPLMMPFSLLARAISNLFAFHLGLTTQETNPIPIPNPFVARYLVGAYTLLAISYITILFAVCKNSLNNWIPFLLTVVGATLFLSINPLSVSAIKWGHPEEILMGAMILSSGLMLLKKEYVWSAVFLGLSIATKQPAFFIVPTMFLAVPIEHRKKFILVSSATSLIFIVPWIIHSFPEFLSYNFLLAGSSDIDADRGINILSIINVYQITATSKFIILFLAIMIPFLFAKNNLEDGEKLWKMKLTLKQLVWILPYIMFVRVILDIGNIVYYLVPLGFILFLVGYYYQDSWGQIIEKRIHIDFTELIAPVFALAGTIVLFVFFDETSFVDISVQTKSIISLLFFIIITATLFWKLYGLKDIKKNKKPLLYSSLALLATIVTMASLYEYRIVTTPPNSVFAGMFNADPHMIAKALDGKDGSSRGFWLGDPPNNLDIKQNSISKTIIEFKYDNRNQLLTIIEYGDRFEAEAVSVFTYNNIRLGIREIFNTCWKKTCKDDYKRIKTPVGRGVYRTEEANGDPRYNWEVFVINNNRQLIYINNNGAPYPIEKVSTDLQVIE